MIAFYTAGSIHDIHYMLISCILPNYPNFLIGMTEYEEYSMAVVYSIVGCYAVKKIVEFDDNVVIQWTWSLARA